MFRWYLITYKHNDLQRVTSKIALLEVEYYSPVKTSVRKRRDQNSVRETHSPMFPGYLFVRLNPDIVHTSAIGDIPGVKEFVRFGRELSTVSNQLIEALRQSLVLRTDRKVTTLEYSNVPAEVSKALSEIALMKSVVERQAALFNLLKDDADRMLRGVSRYSTIATSLEIPPVSKKL